MGSIVAWLDDSDSILRTTDREYIYAKQKNNMEKMRVGSTQGETGRRTAKGE